MVCEVRLRKFNTDCKQAGSHGDTHDFQSDGVKVSTPGAGVEDVGAIRTENDTASGSKDDFIDIQLCGTAQQSEQSQHQSDESSRTFSLTTSENIEN